MARRCGFCGIRGHDKRNCSILAKQAKENPGDWAASVLTQTKRNKTTNRKCSYCREPGHTKRTCKILMTDREHQKTLAAKWRATFASNCRFYGFGVGALLKFRNLDEIKNDWIRQRVEMKIKKWGEYFIVLGFRTEELDHRHLKYALPSVRVRYPSGYEAYEHLPIEFMDCLDSFDEPPYKIVGKIDSEDFIQSLGLGFFAGEGDMDFHLPNCK
jgi:hypothetical protein